VVNWNLIVSKTRTTHSQNVSHNDQKLKTYNSTMKTIIKLTQLVSILFVITSCSKPSLKEALRNNDENLVKSIINSGDFDPNMWSPESPETLFEIVVRKYNDSDLADKIAAHPSLTMLERDKALYSMLRDIRVENEEYVIDDPDRKISLKSFTKAFYLLMKPLPESESTLIKTDLNEEYVTIYNGIDFYIFSSGGFKTVVFDKPYETQNVLDVQKSPEYKDVVNSSPGKELIFYVLHPAGMNPNAYVKVFADPLLEESDNYDVNYWNDKLLFAAIYPNEYIFDGSMHFPDDLKIQYNKLIEAADYDGYLTWVENNLHSFSYSDSKGSPQRIPDQFKSFSTLDDIAPFAINQKVTEFEYDLILLRSVHSYGEPTIILDLAVYKEQNLLKTSRVINQDIYDIPEPQVTMKNGIITIFEEGYKLETDANAEGTINSIEKQDSTYYFSVDQNGELIPWSREITIQGNVIDRLSAKVELNGFGDVRFVTAREEKLNLYLVKEGAPIFQFPTHRVNQWMPEEDNQNKWNFTFTDLNGDGLKDLIYLASAITGNGPNGMDVFPVYEVYLRGGDQFLIQEEVGKNSNEFSTMKEIEEFVKERFN